MGLIYFAIFVALLIAVIQNYDIMNYKTSLKFFHLQTPEFPLAILLVLSFAVGYIIGYIRSAPAVIKSYFKSKEVEKLNKKLEEIELEEKRKLEEQKQQPQQAESQSL